MTFSCVCLCLSLPAELQTICKEFHKRISVLEGDKYDLEWKNKMKNLEVNTARLRIDNFPFTHTFHYVPNPIPDFFSLHVNLQTSDCIYFNSVSLSLSVFLSPSLSFLRLIN